ncbi:hypothetical protein I8H83_02510 [Candidatus Saccharibacteria bacterium]|nr:hypothetical protein [Candidatus Saccharibacteria bacterium]
MAKKTKVLHTPTDPQEFPFRFLLRRGDDFYRFIDLQVVSEPNDRLSVYLKPPLGNLYQSRKPTNKHSFAGVSGSQSLTLNNDVTKGQPIFNPYATWHGSGKAHINGYDTKSLEQEHVLNDSEAISLSNIAVQPHILFTGLFPLNTLSYIKTTPPPDDYDGNYVEVSDKPYRNNELSKKDTTAHFVLDMSSLRAGSLVMDVMVHNRGVDFDIEKNHPYVADGEMYFVAPPFKIMPDDSLCPAVTVFFYQPVGESDEGQLIEKQPSTIWIRSVGTKAEQFVQFEPL